MKEFGSRLGIVSSSDLTVQNIQLGGIFVVKASCTAAADTKIYDANAPFKFKVLYAWAIATANETTNTWKLTDGTTDITDGMAVGGADKTVDTVATIDDAKYEISEGGSLVAADVSSSTNATAEVFALCQRTG